MNDEQVRQIIRDELSQLIKSDRYTIHKTLQILNGRNVAIGTSDGTKFGTESTQKIAFLGSTPVSQQGTTQDAVTFVANSSGISNDSATYDSYSVGDIVKILKKFGFIS